MNEWRDFFNRSQLLLKGEPMEHVLIKDVDGRTCVIDREVLKLYTEQQTWFGLTSGTVAQMRTMLLNAGVPEPFTYEQVNKYRLVKKDICVHPADKSWVSEDGTVTCIACGAKKLTSLRPRS